MRLRPSRDDALERNLVWMVGSPRTGTTWLLNLLVAHARVHGLDEPLIGAHLGVPAASTVGGVARSPRADEGSRLLDVFRGRDGYFFSDRYADAWRPALRQLLLARLGAQLHDLGGDPRNDVLVVKEPHGSEAADILADTLPQSRLLIVVRDGRDVVDSMLDALQPGAWASDLATLDPGADERRRFIADYGALWSERIRVVLSAQSGRPPEQQRLVRYEDLLADPVEQVAGILRWMGLEPPPTLREHVERLSFDRVSEEHRGTGNFHRAASPGLWRQQLAPDEQALANEVMGPVLERLGYPAS
jgi:hypothetical protein